MSDTSRLVTAAELEKFPDDDYRYELVEGRVIRMSPTGYEHGRIVARLLWLLETHLRARRVGSVVTEVGFKLRSNPDTVRAPDVAFVRQARIPTATLKGFWTGPPDLAIEVLSPDDRAVDLRAKVEEYLSCGVAVVVVIDPDEPNATIHRATVRSVTLRSGDQLDLDDVVEGFRCSLQEVFD